MSFKYSQMKLNDLLVSGEDNSITYLVFSKDIVFRLPAYGTIIGFAEDYKFTRFEWDRWNATMVFFNDLQMDGDLVSKFGVGVKNANLTIVDLFVDQRLNIVVDSLSVVNCTIKVYADGFEPCNVTVQDGDLVSWGYDNSSGILTIVASRCSLASVIVDWKELVVVNPEPSPSPEPEPNPPPDTSPPSEPSPEPEPEPPSETPPSESPLPPPGPSYPFSALLGELKSIGLSFSVLLPVLVFMLTFVAISIRLRRRSLGKRRARNVVRRKLINVASFSSGMSGSTVFDDEEKYVMAFRRMLLKPVSKIEEEEKFSIRDIIVREFMSYFDIITRKRKKNHED